MLLDSIKKNTIDKLRPVLIRNTQITRDQIKHQKEKNLQVWMLHREDPFKISPPDNPALQKSFEAYPTTIKPDIPFVCEIENGHFVGQNGVALKGHKVILESITTAPDSVKNALYFSTKSILYNSIGEYGGNTGFEKPKSVFPLITPHRSYYHWVVEKLTQLRFLEYYQTKTSQKPYLVVENNPDDFVIQSLEAMGINNKRIIEWDRNYAKFKKIVIPIQRRYSFNENSHNNQIHDPSINDILWLKNKLSGTKNFEHENRDSQRIYISRQKAADNHTSARNVMNFKEIEKILRDFDFKIFNLENLEFNRQIKLFNNANVILGPHGAGIVNMIFSKDPTVIELFPDNVVKPHFYYLSHLLGYDYESIVTKSKDGQLIVNKNLLRKKLDTILNPN
jgi:hypothetical protein